MPSRPCNFGEYGDDDEMHDDYYEHQRNEDEEMGWQLHEHSCIGDKLLAGVAHAAMVEAKKRTEDVETNSPDFIKVNRPTQNNHLDLRHRILALPPRMHGCECQSKRSHYPPRAGLASGYQSRRVHQSPPPFSGCCAGRDSTAGSPGKEPSPFPRIPAWNDSTQRTPCFSWQSCCCPQALHSRRAPMSSPWSSWLVLGIPLIHS